MKISTKIYTMNCDGTFDWEVKILDQYYFVTERLEISDKYSGKENSLEKAEKEINSTIENIKKCIVSYEKKKKEFEQRIGKKVWDWDDETNNFKEIKGGY